MFPTSEADLPSRPTTIIFSAFMGAATVSWASLIHRLPFYHSISWVSSLAFLTFPIFMHNQDPKRVLLGTLIGAIAGYVLHNESTLAWRRYRIRDEYRTRLAEQALYDKQQDEIVARAHSSTV